MTRRQKKYSKRNVPPKKSEIKKKKKYLLELYRELKNEQENISKEVSLRVFNRVSEIPKSQLEVLFGTYTQFKDEAEDYFRKKLPIGKRALLSERSKKFDPSVTKEQAIEDLRKVQKDNDAIYITRNFYRVNGSYSDATWSNYFGTFQEFRRQAGLELTRHQHKVEKHIAKVASIEHYREFFNEEILPYYNKYQKKSATPHHVKTLMVMSDLHDKECCEFSLSLFIETCRRKQPDVIILNGDIYDLLEFGRYKTDIRDWDIKGRFKFVRDNVFKPLRKHCPNAQIDLIAGNHEMRLLKLLADATPNVRILLSDVLDIGFAEVFGLDEFEINWASKFDLAAYSKSDLNKETKKNYRIYFNSYVAAHIPDKRLKNLSGTNGHHHLGELNSHAFMDPITNLIKRTTWVQTPGMHHPDAQYLDNTAGWNTGFLEVTVNIKTEECIQKIHFTQDGWSVIDGIYYEKGKKI